MSVACDRDARITSSDMFADLAMIAMKRPGVLDVHLREHASNWRTARRERRRFRWHTSRNDNAQRRNESMKVQTLIEILQECDADADVYIMGQQGYPFENAVHGVAVRADFVEYDDEEEVPAGDRWTAHETKLPRNDVFIVEGSQTRYGNSEAWPAARRH
jgi:hypothetical protein